MTAIEALPQHILDRVAEHLYKLWETETYYSGRRNFTEIDALMQARCTVARLSMQLFCEFLRSKGIFLRDLCGGCK